MVNGAPVYVCHSKPIEYHIAITTSDTFNALSLVNSIGFCTRLISSYKLPLMLLTSFYFVFRHSCLIAINNFEDARNLRAHTLHWYGICAFSFASWSVTEEETIKFEFYALDVKLVFHCMRSHNVINKIGMDLASKIEHFVAHLSSELIRVQGNFARISIG